MHKLKPYATEYKAAGGAVYAADIWATSWTDALLLAARRGLREKVISYNAPVKTVPAHIVLRSRRSLVDKMHALTWLAHLATSAKVAEPAEFFDDQLGVIHRFCHYASNQVTSESRPFQDLLTAVMSIENRVPGYPRS